MNGTSIVERIRTNGAFTLADNIDLTPIPLVAPTSWTQAANEMDQFYYGYYTMSAPSNCNPPAGYSQANASVVIQLNGSTVLQGSDSSLTPGGSTVTQPLAIATSDFQPGGPPLTLVEPGTAQTHTVSAGGDDDCQGPGHVSVTLSEDVLGFR